MFPKKAKDAAKELKKLGVGEVARLADGPEFSSPVFEPRKSARIELTMRRGLIAENNARYVLAEKLYQQAHSMDPADPTPLRYLGELYRHHIGDWTKAKTTFNTILDMRADPLSRAVALHGLGKITIHEGQFKQGLHLMEQSVAEYPLALAYRNLAVYWNSKAISSRATSIRRRRSHWIPKILTTSSSRRSSWPPPDIVTKLCGGPGECKPAAGLYNLAAIYAQNSQREKALQFLKRHFYQYERYHAVRSKEMMEARVDAVFDSLRQDSAFLALTRDADGRLMMPMKGMVAQRIIRIEELLGHVTLLSKRWASTQSQLIIVDVAIPFIGIIRRPSASRVSARKAESWRSESNTASTRASIIPSNALRGSARIDRSALENWSAFSRWLFCA